MRKIKGILALFIAILFISGCANSPNQSSVNNDNQDIVNNDHQENEKNKWEEIKDAGKIVVGTSGTLIAASYYDGEEESEDQLTGYDVEVMREIADRLDVDVSFEIMGIDSMLPAIKSGRIDLAVNDIEATEKRKEEFNFSEPYKYSYTTMVVRKEDNSGINSLEDLEGKEYGGGATTIYGQIAEHFGANIN